MRRCMRSREQQQQQQPLAVQQEPPVDASYLRQTAAAALSFAELSGLSCSLNSSSSRTKGGDYSSSISRTKGGHYCSSKQRESSSTRRDPESSCSSWNGCGNSRNTGGDGRGKDEDSSNRLNSGNSSSDFFRCFFASPADTCSKTGFPCLFSDTGNGNSGCCPPTAVGVRKLRCVSAPEKTGLSLHSETKQRQLYLQRGFSEHQGQQEQSLQQQRLQQPVEQQQQQHLEQQVQQRVQQHEQHQQRVQQHEHQEQQQQRQDDFMRKEGREPPNCEGDLKACAGETEVASWDRRQLSNSSSSNSSSSSTETDEGATRRRKVVMRESATRDEDVRSSFSEGRGQKAEGTSSSQIGKESVERSSNAEEKKLIASRERELERTSKEVKETVAQETNQAGTTETQTLSRSVLSALSFSQLLIKPCVRSATVYGLRQLLLQLLQLQRQTYISSCLDPTQRITHLLSQGRLKAERHSVRTADGYQIFFYRLCQVKTHCCCSWCTHSHHPRCTYSAAFSVGCPYTPSPQQQYCTGNSSSSVSSKNRKECRASRASSVGDGQQSSGSHRNPSNSNSSSKDDDSSFQIGRRTCTARRDGGASSSSTAAVADAATEVGVTEKSHPTCAAVLSSKWEMPLLSCADQQEKIGGFPSRSSRCSSFQKSQQKGCCCCCSILGKARGEATTAASNRSRNAICVSQPVIRSEATAYPPPSPGDTAACSRWSSTDTRGSSSSSSDSMDSSCCRSRRRRSSRRRRRNRNSSNRSSSNRGSKDRESDAARSNIYTKNSSSRNSSTCSRSRSRGKSSKRKKRDTCMAPCKGEAARCSWRSEEERTRHDTPAAAAAAASRCLQQHQQQNQIEEESSRHCGFKERDVSLRVKEESSACAMHAAAQLHLPMERPFIAATWEGMWMKGEAAEGEEDTAATNGVGSDNAAAAAAAKVEGNDSNAAVVVARAAAAAAQAAVLGNNTRSAAAVEVMGSDIISAATPAVQGPCSAGSSTKASTRSGEGRLNDQEAATEADTAAEAVNEEKGTVKEETLGWWREKIKEAGMSSIEMGGRSRNSVNKHPVVYMQHGLLESSLNWVSGGDGSLAFALAYEGCDVWLGNNRGNEYTRLLPLDRSRRPRRNRCMHSTPHGCSCYCCLGSPAAASHKINSAAINGTDRVCGTRNSGTNTAATGSKSAIGGRTAAAAGGRRSITTARLNRSPTVIEEEAVEWPAGFSAAASHRICRSRDRTSKEVSVTVGDPSDAPVKNTTTWMRCLKGWKGGREVYQGLSGHEIENYLHTEIDALRKKSQRSRQLGGGVYRHSPQELQQINAEKKHREQRRNKEDAATEIAQARTEEEEKAAAAAAAAPATAATIAATDNSPQQLKDVHLRQARWRRRTRRIMRGALCCSALCCHCTGLTPLPEFEKGVSMQMQRQQLRQACVDAFAVLLLLLGPGNSRRSLQKRREKEAHHRLLQQGEHQQAGAHEKNKMKQQQQQQPQRLIQKEGFNNIYATSSGSEPQQQSNEQEGRWLISRERQRSNISLSGNVRAQQQQRQRDIDPCATSWGDVTEENRLSGVYWRRDRRRSYEPCSRLTKEERQRTDTFIIVNALDAASGEVGTHRRNSSCEDASVAGVGQDQQQEIHESRWEKEGKQQVAEVPEPTEKDLEAPVDIENLSSCSSSEDDEVPPFRSALRSATGQQWTYRDMAAYDVPAMLDYILSFRQETSTAAATAIRNRCGMDRAPTSRCRQTACACRGAHIASDTAVQQDFNGESLYSATPASSWGQHLLSTGREEIHKDALESIVATEQQRDRLVLQEPQKPQQVQQQEQQEEQLQKQQHNHLQSESCTVPAYQEVLLREGEGPPQKQCAEGVDEKRLYVSCPERQEEVESSSKQQAHKTEREEENKGDSFLGSIWAVGQSQGAAQLLAMLALYPALGLLFRGVVLFSPPVVLQAPGTLSTSARMFINLALQMPEKVLLSIRAAEQLLPVPVLSLLGDFVAGKRLMGFYTGSIGWQQRCINFRYTPSGGTSKRNFDLWVGSMARASCSNIKNSRRSSRSASSHNSQRRASVTRKERAALASSRDAPAGAASVASDAADESLTPATAFTSRLGDGHDRKGSSETDAESEIGKGSAASYPLERICCPIFALLGGKDNLVDADASSNHLLHYLKRTQLLHVEIWKESGHLDFGWAQARRVDLYPRLLRLLLSPKYSQELQKHCLQLLLQQQ